MHIPSTRVFHEMRSEEASLWFVPATGGEELALLIKTPSSSIKALLAGCSLHLLFGLREEHLCTGARIFDMPDAPLLVSGIQRDAEEHAALLRAIQERHFPVFVFNEMDICLAWTNVVLQEQDSINLLSILGDVKKLYVGPFTSECSYSLDCFCYSTDNAQVYTGAIEIPFVDIPTVLEPWRTNNVSFVGHRGVHTITLDDPDEGEMLERAVWAALESVFPVTLHKSPQVSIGLKTRELTDVLAYHEYGNFLIEVKDSAVLKAVLGRDQHRRTKGIQKQVKKAITQLIGASKAVTRGEEIFDLSGEKLNIDRDKAAHCIVIVTELMNSGDWNEIKILLMKAMISTGAFFHLLDLREFITILKASSGDKCLLDYNLIERCKQVIEHNSIHIRSRIVPKPLVELS